MYCGYVLQCIAPSDVLTSLDCAHFIWSPCLMWNCWSTKHFSVFKSSGWLISKPSLITKATHWNRRMMRVIKGGLGYWAHIHCHFKDQQSLKEHYHCLLCRCSASQVLEVPDSKREGLQRCYLSQIPSTWSGLKQWKACGLWCCREGFVCNQCSVLRADPNVLQGNKMFCF